MASLASKRCLPCEGGTPPLSAAQAKTLLAELQDWKIENGKISRTIVFKNFKEALALVNKIGELAEKEGHHPDIFLFSWNKVTVTLWTHAIKGLSENDFILAAKIDKII